MSRESRSGVIVEGVTYVAVDTGGVISCDGCDLSGRLCHYVDGCTEEYRVDGLNVIWKAQGPSGEAVNRENEVTVNGITYIAVDEIDDEGDNSLSACRGCALDGRPACASMICDIESRKDERSVIWIEKPTPKSSSEGVITTEIRPASSNSNQKWGSW